MTTHIHTPTLGISFWNHYEQFEEVERSVEYLHELGVTHIRIGISWADWCRTDGYGGVNWHKWVFETLKGFTIMPCVWFTPVDISENGKTNGPPERLRDYGDFINEVIRELGDQFQTIELWNEPNNELKWSREEHDPHWNKFAEMILWAAQVAKQHNKQTVLGGMSPIDSGWMKALWDNGAMDHIDVVGVHAFPGQWNEPGDAWGGWPEAIDYLRQENPGKKIWVTESGASTRARVEDSETESGEARQVAVLDEIMTTCPVERAYFYTLCDLIHDELEWSVNGYREPLEHSLGVVTADGKRKKAFHRLQNYLKNDRVDLHANVVSETVREPGF